MALRLRKRRGEMRLPEVTFVPLIDTALTLLIIFIITAPMMRTTLKVDLPDSRTSQTTKIEEQSISVEIDKNGIVHFDDTLFDVRKSNKQRAAVREQLKRRIAQRVAASRTNNTVFLYADKSLRYKKIVKVFDLLNATDGVQHVALVTQKIK